MYQSVIRDPSGSGLIRIVPDVCNTHSAVVDGSILIVPAGTTAFVVVNGMLSQPYGPGRYELFTGVDPFFVRLRNIMTRGDPGISVSVFFLSTQKEKFFQLGTGEIPFCERRFRLTMNALASCNLTFSISNSRKLLEKMIGAYSTSFSEEDLEPCLEQLVLAPIREVLSRELGTCDIVQFNNSLTGISRKMAEPLSALFADYGLRLIRFAVTSINVPREEMQRLHQLEQSFAEGKTRTDLELDHLSRVWNGNIGQRTIVEAMTGINSRGGAGTSGNAQHSGGMNDMSSMLMQTMFLSQLLPMLQEPLASMAQHTDLFGGTPAPPNQDTSSADAPPPIPRRTKRCPICNSNVPRSASGCPICGHRFSN